MTIALTILNHGRGRHDPIRGRRLRDQRHGRQERLEAAMSFYVYIYLSTYIFIYMYRLRDQRHGRQERLEAAMSFYFKSLELRNPFDI